MHHQVRIVYNLTGNSSALVASFRLSHHEYTSTADTHRNSQLETNTARTYVHVAWVQRRALLGGSGFFFFFFFVYDISCS